MAPQNLADAAQVLPWQQTSWPLILNMVHSDIQGKNGGKLQFSDIWSNAWLYLVKNQCELLLDPHKMNEADFFYQQSLPELDDIELDRVN